MMSYMYLFSKLLCLFTGDTATRRKVGKNWFNSQTCSFVCLARTTIFIHSPLDFCFRAKHTVKLCPQLLRQLHLVDIDQGWNGCSLVLLPSLTVPFEQLFGLQKHMDMIGPTNVTMYLEQVPNSVACQALPCQSNEVALDLMLLRPMYEHGRGNLWHCHPCLW